jgi:hypothetical protein
MCGGPFRSQILINLISQHFHIMYSYIYRFFIFQEVLNLPFKSILDPSALNFRSVCQQVCWWYVKICKYLPMHSIYSNPPPSPPHINCQSVVERVQEPQRRIDRKLTQRECWKRNEWRSSSFTIKYDNCVSNAAYIGKLVPATAARGEPVWWAILAFTSTRYTFSHHPAKGKVSI